MTEHDWMNEDEMRRILGADPDPSLTAEQRRAIVRRVRAEEEAALDRVLGRVEVELPEGLTDRVRARVADERAGELRAERRRQSTLRLVGGGVFLAAAAALALVLLRPDPARETAGPQVAGASDVEPGRLRRRAGGRPAGARGARRAARPRPDRGGRALLVRSRGRAVDRPAGGERLMLRVLLIVLAGAFPAAAPALARAEDAADERRAAWEKLDPEEQAALREALRAPADDVAGGTRARARAGASHAPRGRGDAPIPRPGGESRDRGPRSGGAQARPPFTDRRSRAHDGDAAPGAPDRRGAGGAGERRRDRALPRSRARARASWSSCRARRGGWPRVCASRPARSNASRAPIRRSSVRL